MKKSFLFFVIFCFGVYNYASSQITTRKSAPEQTNNHPIVFDSIHDYPQSSPESWVGQILYVKPCCYNLKHYGLPDFKRIKKKRNGDIEIKGTYGKINNLGNAEATEYQDLEGKYLIVKQYIPSDQIGSHSDGYLLLQNQLDSTDVFAWIHHKYFPTRTSYNQFENPFIAVSHYNYLKRRYIGEKLIISPYVISNKDIETGLSIKPQEMSYEWNCIDISYVEENDCTKLSLIIKQENTYSFVPIKYLWLDSNYFYYGHMVINYPIEKHIDFKPTYGPDLNDELDSDIPCTNEPTHIYRKGEFDLLCKKYGEESMKYVIKGIVLEGMPAHLLFLAKGMPTHINSSSRGSQLVYSKKGKYYYTTAGYGGTVTGWN